MATVTGVTTTTPARPSRIAAGTTIKDHRPDLVAAGAHDPDALLELADELHEHGFEPHRQIVARGRAAGALMRCVMLGDGRIEATCRLEGWVTSTVRGTNAIDTWASALRSAVHRGLVDDYDPGRDGRPDRPC